MNVAMETENPVCIRIRVIRLFRMPKMPPYTDTSGTISTWNGMTMEAIMSANSSEQAFQFWLRTMTKDAMAENRMVSTVAQNVMIAEFLNTFQKSILAIASGKFWSVNPCSPIRASGSDVISPLILNTLISTRRKGMTNMMKTMISTMIVTI